MGGREGAMLLALAALWGGSFFFNGVAVRELPSLTLVWLRVAVAALALLLTLRMLGQSLPRDRCIWAAFLGMGLLNNALPFVLIVWGQHRIASGLAAILNATTPLFGALGGFSDDIPAQLACLAAALSYAFAGIYGRRFRRLGVAPLAAAAGQVCASTLLLLPVMLLIDQPWTLAPPNAATWGAVLGVGLLSTALAYWLYFRILAASGATNLLLVTFLIPVSAILLGVSVLGETLQPRHLLGMALIGGGLAFIDGRPLRRLQPARHAEAERR
jgi:drug/metabolite transporter (DMT)-like permease